MNQEKQIETYGCTIAELKDSVEKTMDLGRVSSVNIAMDYAVATKNLIKNSRDADAIQFLNRLNWILSTYVMDDE